ncbi:MAG: tripartite tricarboxylate transporter substrate binding protein [Polaromonas sp.]|uniref:Bug family tripartite tricarboxylate transporter substrate binding protein n=1 Tax=Polaromonas sp. TaxID=1869339 RepID=UPI0025CED45A|nr:tripartite tricarboxylate transporter substrate binding protein [Polaromonas sp.]MBI2727166.1 tripartite tricarboxylate transporter substrate binding protein [Polaromonas sp.]
MKRRTIVKILLGNSTMGASSLLFGQPKSDQPIHIVVPYPAGGNTDLVTREIARALSDRLGTPVIIDNKVGANSIIGSDFVAKAAPDGRTILTTLGAFTINPFLYKNLPYSLDQFSPISLLGQVNLILAVGSELPAKSFDDLIKYAKSGARVTYDSSGVGSALHIVGERISRATGLKATHIPYKGISQSLPDIVAGRVTFTLNTVASLGPFINEGKLRPLVTLSRSRSPQLPGVPTIIEAGYPALESYGWQGFVAPAKTPKRLIDQLSRDISAVLQAPDMRKKLVGMGMDAIGSSPAEFESFIKDDTAKVATTIKEAGIVAE